MPHDESVFSNIVSVIVKTQKFRNTVIGTSRALDPNPQVNQQRPHFTLCVMSFDGGFAKDRANLAMDLYDGECKALKVFGIDNGKKTICA